MSKGIKYTSEFKREAVKLVQLSNKPRVLIAEELGVKAKTLYNWVSTATKGKNLNSKTNFLKTKSKHHYQELEQENQKLKIIT